MHLKNLLLFLLLLHLPFACFKAKQKSDSTPPATEQQQSTDQTAPNPEQQPPSPENPENFEPVQQPETAEQPPSLAPLPSSTEMTNSYENAFVRMLVTLLGLVFLVFVTFWILRRLGKGKFKLGSGQRANIIERRALSPKTMLYVVEIGNKKILISESQLEVRALTTIEETPETSD